LHSYRLRLKTTHKYGVKTANRYDSEGAFRFRGLLRNKYFMKQQTNS